MTVPYLTERVAGRWGEQRDQEDSPARAAGGLLVDRLSIRYDGQDGGSVLAVDDVSFRVGDGEFVAIVGPSGCGKSTLLKAVAGLLSTSQGKVAFGGGSDTRLGFVFQSDGLLPWRTAAENVEIAMRMSGRQGHQARRSNTDLREHVLGLLEEFGLRHAADRYPAQLSGGMRKRVALARAVAYQPSALLMDEPFSALDAQTRIHVGNFFLRMLEDLGQTVLFVTHDIDESVAMADRVIVLSQGPGQVVEDITVDIPRPRDYHDTRFHPAFRDLQQRVWNSLGYNQHGEKEADA